MSNLASAGLTQLVDAIDTTSSLAVVAAKATVDSGQITIEALVDALGDTADSALDRVEALRLAYVSELRRVATAIGEASPL